MRVTRSVGLLVMAFVMTALFGVAAQDNLPVKEAIDADGAPTQVFEYTPANAVSQSLGGTCKHDVEHPHHSTHFPGRINVTAWTQCNVFMNNIIVTAELHKKTCLWYFCFWDTVDITYPPEQGHTYVEAQANIVCESGTYRGRVNSLLIFPDGHVKFMYWIGASRTLDCG